MHLAWRLGNQTVSYASSLSVYLEDPEPQGPSGSGRGKQPVHPKAQSAPLRIDQWAAEQPPAAWQMLTLRGGEKGQLVAEYLHAHVWVRDGSKAHARRWLLLVRREVGASEISRYCPSNAPAHTPWPELARVQAQRFFIEHSFCEAKRECGLADYQVRRWDAWHHHTLVMLGTLFLVKQKIAGRKPWPMLSFNLKNGSWTRPSAVFRLIGHGLSNLETRGSLPRGSSCRAEKCSCNREFFHRNWALLQG